MTINKKVKNINSIQINKLNKTWIFDLDGTLVVHNGFKIFEKDILLEKTKESLNLIPDTDKIIILTARKSEYKEQTINFLKNNNIRFDDIIFDLPNGERILINDTKPSGYETAYSEKVIRNIGLTPEIIKKYE